MIGRQSVAFEELDYERFYFRTPIGQLLLHDMELADYLKMTLGSGDPNQNASQRSRPSGKRPEATLADAVNLENRLRFTPGAGVQIEETTRHLFTRGKPHLDLYLKQLDERDGKR